MKKYIAVLVALVAIFSTNLLFGTTKHHKHSKNISYTRGKTAYVCIPVSKYHHKHRAAKPVPPHEETATVESLTPTAVVKIVNKDIYVNDEHVMSLANLKNENDRIIINYSLPPAAAPEPASIDNTPDNGDCKAVLGVHVRSCPDQGAMITYVIPCSPAAMAGLMPGDVITHMDTHDIDNSQQLLSTVCDYKPGDKVTVGYMHYGRMETTDAALTEKDKPTDCTCGCGESYVPACRTCYGY